MDQAIYNPLEEFLWFLSKDRSLLDSLSGALGLYYKVCFSLVNGTPSPTSVNFHDGYRISVTTLFYKVTIKHHGTVLATGAALINDQPPNFRFSSLSLTLDGIEHKLL